MTAIGLFCASSGTLDTKWLDLAAETARGLASRGHMLVSRGSRTGMMGAAADAARVGERALSG
jgi:predicted Rossmann-fold nucleotide-binding protein